MPLPVALVVAVVAVLATLVVPVMLTCLATVEEFVAPDSALVLLLPSAHPCRPVASMTYASVRLATMLRRFIVKDVRYVAYES